VDQIKEYKEVIEIYYATTSYEGGRVTVHRDLHYKIEETRSKARSFLEERIPFENEVCRIGL
jgi:hypothetical protein